jgi:hypothetical protein
MGSKAPVTTDPYERDDVLGRTGESGMDARGFSHAPEERPPRRKLKPRRSAAGRSAPGQSNEDAEQMMDVMQAAHELERDHPGAGVSPQWDEVRQKAGALEAEIAALKAVIARSVPAGSASHPTHTMPPGSPGDEPGTARADVVDQQPASLTGGPRESVSQDYLASNFNAGHITVQHMDLRAAAGQYAGLNPVSPNPMERAVMTSNLSPCTTGGGSPAPFAALTGLAPGESR